MLQPQWQKVHMKLQPDPYRVAKRVFPLIMLHGLAAVLVVAINWRTGFRLQMPSVVHPLLGGVLGLLLAFRTNQAYERHWSSCKTWAEIQAIIHNMTRLASQLSRSHWQEYTAIVRFLIAYPIALKQHLQRRRDPSEFRRVLDVKDIKAIINTRHPHMMILSTLSMLIRPMRLRDDGTGKLLALWTRLEGGVDNLQEAASRLNLVSSMPFPISYSVHMARFIFLWVVTLPFALVGVMHPLLVILTMIFVSWALYATEELAQLMEDPFGTANKPETIPLEKYSRQIVDEVKEQILVQDILDLRVMSRTWVVKPEDLAGDVQAGGMDVSKAYTVD